MGLIRLNKYLSQAGVVSRREADRLISAGRVRVNGKAVGTLGIKVDEGKDEVTVDKKKVVRKEKFFYLLLNKPPGYLVTLKDPFRRPTVLSLLPSLRSRVFPVGRLDYDSEGLLLLTSDGELAHRLMHPRYGVKKIYRVKVQGVPEPARLRLVEKGVLLDGRKTAPCRVRLLGSSAGRALLRIELIEGRKREIKRMFDVIGNPVQELKRLQFDGLQLGRLRRGQWRFLTAEEVSSLRESTGMI
jgi:pseudouridine synthase